MANLLEETKATIKRCGYGSEDIGFIGSKCGRLSCTWEYFKVLADREYDSGYGMAEVALDLIIVFKGGGRLERYEYDGSEHWIYIPVLDYSHKGELIRSLFGYSVEGED
jgi:hypothetical protein